MNNRKKNLKNTIKIFLKTELGSFLSVFILGGLILLVVAMVNMNKVLSEPAFTVGKIRYIEEGTKGTNYVVFEYMVDSILYVEKQSRSLFSGGKRRLDETTSNNYLVVYNRKRIDKAHMLNVKVWQAMGTDLSNEYDLAFLKEEGLISILDF